VFGSKKRTFFNRIVVNIIQLLIDYFISPKPLLSQVFQITSSSLGDSRNLDWKSLQFVTADVHTGSISTNPFPPLSASLSKAETCAGKEKTNSLFQ
jgi:hypothetical protein